MRFDKVRATLELALDLAASSIGLTIDDIRLSRGVSRSTAERMRNLVEDTFGPLERIRDGKAVRFRLRLPKGVNFVVTPTAEELAELMNLARAMRPRDPARATLLENLFTKVKAALRPDDRRRLEPDIEAHLETEVWAHIAGPSHAGKPEVLRTIRHAILADRAIRITYRRVGDETSRTYTVIPYGFVLGSRHYLVAGFPDGTDPHLLRLDRIDEATELDMVGRRPEGFDLSAYAERSFGFFQEEPQPVELVFGPTAAAEAKATWFHPRQVVEALADGSLRVSFEAGGLMELARFLTPWVNRLRVIKPDRLKEFVSDMCDDERIYCNDDATNAR